MIYDSVGIGFTVTMKDSISKIPMFTQCIPPNLYSVSDPSPLLRNINHPHLLPALENV